MSLSNKEHDAECGEAVDQLLKNWRSGKDLNNFIGADVSKNATKKTFPSPDAGFYSHKTRSSVALEYKPAERETKRGILTGLGQSIAYLNGNTYSASILVVPETIDDFPISDFLKTIFDQQIYHKLPIALYKFKNNEPSNIICLKNISNRLANLDQKDPKSTEQTYWAAWRETYPSVICKILEIAAQERSHGTVRREKIWENYFYNVYRDPPNADQTIDLLQNTKLYRWLPSEKLIWLETTKKQLKKAVESKEITEEEAVIRLKWAAAKDRSELDQYYPTLEKIKARLTAGKPTWLPKHNGDNTYTDIKKNTRNGITHLQLWDNDTWTLTAVGNKFLSRSQSGADALEDLAALLLIKGKWGELINDICRIQKNFTSTHLSDSNIFLEKLKSEFVRRGYIGLNEGRKSTGQRKFLQAEKQIMSRINVIKTSQGKETFFQGEGLKFDMDRIARLSDLYYAHYADAFQEVA